MPVSELHIEFHTALQVGRESIHELLMVLRMHEVQEPLESWTEIGAAEADHLVEAVVPEELSRADIPVEDTVVGSLHDQRVALLACPQFGHSFLELRCAFLDPPFEGLVELANLIFGLLALGYVLVLAYEVGRITA